MNSPLQYDSYLELERLLACQHLASDAHGRPAHDELLFIVTHQAYELWFKVILHELESVIRLFDAERIEGGAVCIAADRLERVTRIQSLLIEQMKVLETMAPPDYLDFREFLFPASGFQSLQYRLIETRLGLKPEQRLLYNQFAYHTRVPVAHQDILKKAEEQPSLYSLVERWLERMPFVASGEFDFVRRFSEAVTNMIGNERETVLADASLDEKRKQVQLEELERTTETFGSLLSSELHEEMLRTGRRRMSHKASISALMIFLYREQPALHARYRILSLLVSIDTLFTTWRYSHSLVVHRMLGRKIGTGGSSGHHYLVSTAENHKVFTDLMEISTFLLPHIALPALPPRLVRDLGFHHSI
jgi:tryptophan 2,3-dioxygenase